MFGQEDGNVKLLSMYNLRVGNKVEKGMVISPLESPSGIQSSSSVGRGNGDATYPLIGTTAFSSDGSTVYSGSLVEGYVNNYRTYLESFGINIVSARLITYDEMIALGMTIAEEVYFGDYDWLFLTSYWTETSAGSIAVWSMNASNSEYFWTFPAEYNHSLGVRPVIEIPLSEFE